MVAEKRDFDAEAAGWDTSALRVEVARAVAVCIMDNVPLTKKARILDCGCGTGLVTLLLAQRAGEVLAIDTSAGMIGQLKVKAERLGIGNIRTVIGTIQDVPGVDPNFDLVVCTQTLAHVESVDQTLRGLRRYLAPQGVLAISEMDSDEPRTGFEVLKRSSVAAMVNHLGFVVTDVLDAIDIRSGTDEGATVKRYYVLFATLAKEPEQSLRPTPR